jgi:hypothetical protein
MPHAEDGKMCTYSGTVFCIVRCFFTGPGFACQTPIIGSCVANGVGVVGFSVAWGCARGLDHGARWPLWKRQNANVYHFSGEGMCLNVYS